MAVKKFEKLLLVDIFEATFYKVDSNGDRKIVFHSHNLTNSGINNSQDEQEVRNGAGNGLFAVLGGQKTVEISLTENVFDLATIAVNTGADITTGANVGITSPKYGLTVDALGKKLTLEKAPIESAEVEIYDAVTGEEILSSTYSISDAEITFTTSPENPIDIMPYKYATAETSQSIVVEADKFAEGGELWLKSVLKNPKEKAVAYIYFVCKNVKPTGQFEINTTSEKQPNDMAVNMKVMKDENNRLYEIVFEPIV